MANSDYTVNGSGSFCPIAELAGNITSLQTTVAMAGFTGTSSEDSDVRTGSAAMIGKEIVGVVAINGDELTLKRGCYDTVPAPHTAGTVIWFFDDYVGTNQQAYGATETISVKVLPRTTSGGPVPIAKSPPNGLTFNWRFARPYPPGDVRIGGTSIFTSSTHEINAEGGLVISWAHRDRVLQVDQLVGHTEGSIGPEAGATVRVRVYDEDDVLQAEHAGLTGTSWTYTQAQALADFGMVENDAAGLTSGYLTIYSNRDALDSWQGYRVAFNLDPVGAPHGLGLRLGQSLGGVNL